MCNLSPGIVWICPSNTDGNSAIISSAVGMRGSTMLPVDGIIGTDMTLSTASGDGFQTVLALLVCIVTFREDTVT